MFFPCGSVDKKSACNAWDLGLIPGLGRSPGEGKDSPLQYPGLENSMDPIVHGVTVRKRRRKKEPPLRTVHEGLYWAVALGQNSRGRVSEETKGVCEV